MGMPALHDFWTVPMVRALPEDGQRHEAVQGELLVTPAPTLWHQVVVSRLHTALAQYLAEHPVGLLLMGPAEATRGDVTRLQPDLMVVPHTWLARGTYGPVDELLLAIEVLSPASRRQDRFTKRLEYQRAGVPLYWVVDPDGASVEAWTPDATAPSPRETPVHWLPAGTDVPFIMSAADVFARSGLLG
jgi:Uma2 family endonuclease